MQTRPSESPSLPFALYLLIVLASTTSNDIDIDFARCPSPSPEDVSLTGFSAPSSFFGSAFSHPRTSLHALLRND